MASPRIDNLNSYTNLIINGNFDVWQRMEGSTVNFAGTRLYNADRWCHVRSSGYSGNSTAVRSTDVPTLAQSGFQSSYSLLVTNATGLASPSSTDYHMPFQYIMEGQDYQTIHGQACRFQFWIKSSIAGTYPFSLRNIDGTRSYVTTFNVSAANTWEKKTIDITMDSSGTWNFDTNVGILIAITGYVGSAYSTSTLNTWQSGNYFGATSQTNWAGTTGATIQIAQFMLTKGSFSSSTSLTFQRAGRTISDELRMCQRYCQVTGSKLGYSTSPYSANSIAFLYKHAVTLRSAPNSITLYAMSGLALGNYFGPPGPRDVQVYSANSGSSVGSGAVNFAPNLGDCSQEYSSLIFTGGGSWTAGHNVIIVLGSDLKLAISAEL